MIESALVLVGKIKNLLVGYVQYDYGNLRIAMQAHTSPEG
jgi:hypothetical protein